VRERRALLEVSPPPAGGVARGASLALVAAVTLWTYWPTLRNGFLHIAFDDAIVTDTAFLDGLGPRHLWAMASEFVHAHWAPLTFLSLALDRHLWGLDPFGYHLTNLLLHTLTAVLVRGLLRPLLPTLGAATLAALVFAVHPVQMEAVTLAIQRKTLLCALFIVVALIAYQRWRGGGRRGWYLAAVAACAAAALAKPLAVVVAPLLWLYEYCFVDGRLRLTDKLPFLLIGAGVSLAAMAAHEAVGAVAALHGGSLATHALAVARATLEYVLAVLLPVGLSPVYYYQRALAFAPLNFAALALVLLVPVWLLRRRRAWPWTFFSAAWFALALLPESNVFPLATLRADRFLYLGMVGVGVWFAIGFEGLAAAAGRRGPAVAVAAAVVALLAALTHASAGIWRDDVSAWTRVAERHPWSSLAAVMQGHAYREAGNPSAAEAAYREALRRQPLRTEAYDELGRMLSAQGRTAEAEELQRRRRALDWRAP